ncbi:hypothetical protein HDU91_005739, partial [Kappamyces sp. JEL0680]
TDVFSRRLCPSPVFSPSAAWRVRPAPSVPHRLLLVVLQAGAAVVHQAAPVPALHRVAPAQKPAFVSGIHRAGRAFQSCTPASAPEQGAPTTTNVPPTIHIPLGPRIVHTAAAGRNSPSCLLSHPPDQAGI